MGKARLSIGLLDSSAFALMVVSAVCDVMETFAGPTGHRFRGQGRACKASRLDCQVEKRSDKKKKPKS